VSLSLQLAATCCNLLQLAAKLYKSALISQACGESCTALHCNALQLAALQHAAIYYKSVDCALTSQAYSWFHTAIVEVCIDQVLKCAFISQACGKSLALQHTANIATRCAATCCSLLHSCGLLIDKPGTQWVSYCNSLQRVATHCNSLWNALQLSAPRCHSLQHAAQV